MTAELIESSLLCLVKITSTSIFYRAEVVDCHWRQSGSEKLLIVDRVTWGLWSKFLIKWTRKRWRKEIEDNQIFRYFFFVVDGFLILIIEWGIDMHWVEILELFYIPTKTKKKGWGLSIVSLSFMKESLLLVSDYALLKKTNKTETKKGKKTIIE